MVSTCPKLTPAQQFKTIYETAGEGRRKKSPILMHFPSFKWTTDLSFANIAFNDIVGRTEFGFNILDGLIDSLQKAANSEEAYARGLLESANCISAQKIRGTGQGIARFVDGAPQKTTSIVGVGLSAIGLGSLLSSTSNSPDSRSENALLNNLQNVGNGPSSLMMLLDALRAGQSHQAQIRQQHAQKYRKIHQTLLAFRNQQRSRADAIIARGNDTIKATQNVFKELEKCRLRVEKANKELRDAQERLRQARESGGAASESEISKRQRAHDNAMAEIEAAHAAVVEGSTQLVESRLNRDSMLAELAIELEEVESLRNERLVEVFGVMSHCGQKLAQETLTYSQSVTEYTSSFNPSSDTKTFLHQRRLAAMISQQASLHEVRAQRSAGASAFPMNVGASASDMSFGAVRSFEENLSAPEAMTMSHKAKTSRRFLAEEASLGTVASRWTMAILDGVGRDIFESTILPSHEDDDQFIVMDHFALPSAASIGSTNSNTGDPSQLPASEEGNTDSSISRLSSSILDNSDSVLTSTITEFTSLSPTNAHDEARSSLVAASPALAGCGEAFDVLSLVNSHAARIAFLRTLSTERSKVQQLTKDVFFRLCRALWWILDACLTNSDICCARIVMVLAETFYTYDTSGLKSASDVAGTASTRDQQRTTSTDGETDSESDTKEATSVEATNSASSSTEGGNDPIVPSLFSSDAHLGEKIFLQSILKHHPIWSSDGFWEEIFYEAVYETVKASSSPYNSSNQKCMVYYSDKESDEEDTPERSRTTSVVEKQATSTLEDSVDATYDDCSLSQTQPAQSSGLTESPVATSKSPDGENGDTSSTTNSGAEQKPVRRSKYVVSSTQSAKPGTTDWIYAYEQTVFSNLAAVAMNMCTLGLVPPKIYATVGNLARSNGLSPPMISALRDTIKTYLLQGKSP